MKFGIHFYSAILPLYSTLDIVDQMRLSILDIEIEIHDELKLWNDTPAFQN